MEVSHASVEQMLQDPLQPLSNVIAQGDTAINCLWMLLRSIQFTASEPCALCPVTPLIAVILHWWVDRYTVF
jgi:hypothetical protein